jgi:molecular chaperone DnaK
MVHTVKKSLAEHGAALDADEKAKIEAALKEAEEALKSSTDKAEIEAKTEALMGVSQKLSEKMAQDAQAQQAAQGAPGAAHAQSASHDDENVVDAEFKEVKRG